MDRLTRRNADGTPALAGKLDADKMTESMSNGARVVFLDLIKRLAEYEDAEEQGRLVRLPVAVGASMYAIHGGQVSEHEVKRYVLEKCYTERLRINIDTEDILDSYDAKEGSPNLFATRAEAEAAMKRMGGG